MMTSNTIMSSFFGAIAKRMTTNSSSQVYSYTKRTPDTTARYNLLRPDKKNRDDVGASMVSKLIDPRMATCKFPWLDQSRLTQLANAPVTSDLPVDPPSPQEIPKNDVGDSMISKLIDPRMATCKFPWLDQSRLTQLANAPVTSDLPVDPPSPQEIPKKFCPVKEYIRIRRIKIREYLEEFQLDPADFQEEVFAPYDPDADVWGSYRWIDYFGNQRRRSARLLSKRN